MKNVNYKQLKRYSSLPRYDIGTTPINSGYQRNMDQVQTGYFTQNAEPVTQAFVPQARAEALQNIGSVVPNVAQNAFKYINAYNNALSAGRAAAQNAMTTAAQGVYNPAASTLANVQNMAKAAGAEFAKIGGTEAIKSSAKEAASKAFGAANIAMNAFGAIHGGLGLANNWKDSDTLSANDLQNMAARSTEYVNGVAYDRIGGYDSAGVNDYVRAQNKAQKLGGISSGFEAGAGIGGLVGLVGGPLGSLIGSGIGGALGAIGGGFFGHRAREKRKRAIEEAKRRFALSADAYNTQSESEAASQGIRNEYYATHADKGLSVNHKNPNALIQGGEPVVRTKRGKVVSADMFPVTSATPERVDNIPVRLDTKGYKDGVIGNKIDPYTGERLSVEARPLVEAMNNPRIKNKAPYKKALKNMLNLQDSLPEYDSGKPFNRFLNNAWNNIQNAYKNASTGDYRGSFLPMMNYFANTLDNRAYEKEIRREPVTATMDYAPNPYLQQAGALMPKTVDINPELQAIADQASMSKYAIDQSAYSPGQKMAMQAALANSLMKNKAAVYASKTDRENAMRQQYAQWLSQMGEAEAGRKQSALQKYNDQLARGSAEKRRQLDVLRKAKQDNLNKMFENLNNIRWGNKNIDLYYQQLELEKDKIRNQMGYSPDVLNSVLPELPQLSLLPTKKINPGINFAEQARLMFQ